MRQRTERALAWFLGVAMASLTSVACEGTPTAPTAGSSATPLAASLETPAYSFHHAAGDRIDADWQEAFHAWAIGALEVQVNRRIVYNKYLSRAHMGDHTGKYNTNGFAELSSFTIHTLWSTDNHETVHVYTSLFGWPVQLLNEGIAVAHQVNPAAGDFTPRWNGRDLHDWARQFRREGRLIPLANLISHLEFGRHDANVTYPESGSFVRYLLQTYGLAVVKRAFGPATPTDPPDVTRRHFENAFGITIDEAERRWLAMLDGR